MKFLIVGLGSMGKRRVRCVKALGYDNILGLDPRDDRRKEAADKYGIETVSDAAEIDFDKIDLMIISTSPDKHNQYIELAIDKTKPAFVEASIVLKGLQDLNDLAKARGVFIAPSCTMLFHPAIEIIRKIIEDGVYGKVTNFTYHSGQYLPDWHPWEAVTDYYVSQKETSAAREIVPFELTWITELIGLPKRIKGYCGKTMDVGADIDDTYVVSMDFGNTFGSMIVDVVARTATRQLILNMEYGQVLWNWDDGTVKLYEAENQKWIHFHCNEGEAEEGYNKNLIEDMYINEIKSFVGAATGKQAYQNSLDKDIKLLELLEEVEASNATK